VSVRQGTPRVTYRNTWHEAICLDGHVVSRQESQAQRLVGSSMQFDLSVWCPHVVWDYSPNQVLLLQQYTDVASVSERPIPSQEAFGSKSPEDGRISCILLTHLVFCHVSKNVSLYCLLYVTNIYFYHYFNIARDVVTGFAYICWYLSLSSHIYTHAHTQTHTHKHTRMISAYEEWREPGTRSWLEGAEVGFGRNKGLAHTHTRTHSKTKTTAHRDLKSKKIRANRALSKATRPF